MSHVAPLTSHFTNKPLCCHMQFRILSKPCSIVRGVTIDVINRLDSANQEGSANHRLVFCRSPVPTRYMSALMHLSSWCSWLWKECSLTAGTTILPCTGLDSFIFSKKCVSLLFLPKSFNCLAQASISSIRQHRTRTIRELPLICNLFLHLKLSNGSSPSMMLD